MSPVSAVQCIAVLQYSTGQSCSLSQTFFNLRKCVSWDGTGTKMNTHTEGHGNSMTEPAQNWYCVVLNNIMMMKLM